MTVVQAMLVMMQQVLALLNVDEPCYAEASALGPGALPHLEVLIEGPEPMLAAKAAYLAGLMPDARGLPLVLRAATQPDPRVRVAAAAAARNLPQPAAEEVLMALVDDRDGGVRRTVIKSVGALAGTALQTRLDELSRDDPEPSIRQLSAEKLRRLRR